MSLRIAKIIQKRFTFQTKSQECCLLSGATCCTWQKKRVCVLFGQHLHRSPHVYGLMGSHPIVIVNGLVYLLSGLSEVHPLTLIQPSVLHRVVHPLCQRIVQRISRLRHADARMVVKYKANLVNLFYIQNKCVAKSFNEQNKYVINPFRKGNK